MSAGGPAARDRSPRAPAIGSAPRDAAEPDDPTRAETNDATQFDLYGHRYYNVYSDANLDGIVTQAEKYAGYQRFVATIQSLRSTYQYPRTVNVGFKIRF